MVDQGSFLLCILLLGLGLPIESLNLTRTRFPPGFIFGAGSSAYQCEGAANEDGRTPSVWDTFVKWQPAKVLDGSTGDVADEFYHRYKEDIKLMKNIGMDSLRFSISWSRLLPNGRKSGGVNQLGLDFYNNLINELLSKGMEPFVTIWVWDVPQVLEDEYGGFLSPKIVDDFVEYAKLCFEEFGDRVKYWVTVNEPRLFSSFGYAEGKGPPGRCSNTCYAGDSSTEPYIVQHHQLLAHAYTVQLYRTKFQDWQKGKIGITEEAMWMVPKYDTAACRDAASRALDFTFGWTVHPLVYGNYPETMRVLVGERLPNFTKEESEMLIGSFDFLGVNYYTANYVQDSSANTSSELTYQKDSHVTLTASKNGVPIGEPTSISWLFIYPKGLEELLLYVKGHYNNPLIYVTENGLADDSGLPVEELLRDSLRIKYHRVHLQHILKAMEEGGVNVRGYYVWSMMDDYEWDFGYTIRLGLLYVDFSHGLQRQSKDSALWFNNFLQPRDNITTFTPPSTGFYPF